eukprot:GHVT01005165.1.p1 GENE.GHVT01005165.1~~GHVT01005165.1.p1  ORF type:complete len:404 (+),score=84.96 GHVT01005165.1:142-1353(+)
MPHTPKMPSSSSPFQPSPGSCSSLTSTSVEDDVEFGPESNLPTSSLLVAPSKKLSSSSSSSRFPPSPSSAPSSAPSKPSASSSSPLGVVRLLLYICVWYALNIMYNIDNKRSLMMLPLPWTISTIQLFVGWPLFLFFWATGLRPTPRTHTIALFFQKIVPQALCHLLVHIGAVVSMTGAVSFTHIVKATEPVITAVLSALFLHSFFSWQTYASLLPIVLGVAMASLKELSFSWMAFYTALVSALGSSSRAIFAKKAMRFRDEVGTNLNSANMYGMLTIVAALAALPLAILVEGPKLRSTWEASTGASSPFTAGQVISRVAMSGIWYYTYNEVAYLCLDQVDQVTHAVANTVKRVVIIIAAILVFQTPVSPMGIGGSAVAVLGTLLYSLAKATYDGPRPKQVAK